LIFDVFFIKHPPQYICPDDGIVDILDLPTAGRLKIWYAGISYIIRLLDMFTVYALRSNIKNYIYV
jgi:hypothetical protein